MTAKITLLVITDGRRNCLEQTLTSLHQHVGRATFDHAVIVNDHPDPAYTEWVDSLGFDRHLKPAHTKRGFAATVQTGWEAVSDADFVFHLEDDFVFNRPTDLQDMVDVVNREHLAQMALQRQPWNETELTAGGVIGMNPDDYTDMTDGHNHWLTHRLFYTMNPHISPHRIIKRGWPQVPHSEGMFAAALFKDPAIHCGYWGTRSDEPWVTHIGNQRYGKGY